MNLEFVFYLSAAILKTINTPQVIIVAMVDVTILKPISFCLIERLFIILLRKFMEFKLLLVTATKLLFIGNKVKILMNILSEPLKLRRFTVYTKLHLV
jgi:hypothetical protein